MYAVQAPEEKSNDQAKLIVNMVVALFLIIGLFLILQFFHFIYLPDMPVIGGWLMDVYESVFGVPKVLILHGDDSIGDWKTLETMLSKNLFFFSEELDVRLFDAGLGNKLSNYGLIIIQDAKRLDKDKFLNLMDYVKAGGNLIWVGDAGTVGYVEYEGNLLENQSGWKRDIVCIDEISLEACDCDTVRKNSSCRFLPDAAEQSRLDFSPILGTIYSKVQIGNDPELEIVDDSHMLTIGIKKRIALNDTYAIAKVTNSHESSLLANINMEGEAYPGIVVNDRPGAWGQVVFFAYPPEKTPEILFPMVERMRY